MGGTAEAVRRDIAALVESPPAGGLLVDSAVTALGRLVGHDGYCLFGVDPITGLRSVMFSRHGLTASTERLVHNETVERDENRYADLVRRPVRAGVLAPGPTASTGARSPRLHDILPADGYESELRVVLTTPGHYWGALSLFRGDRRRPFDDRDVEHATALVPAVSQVLRRYQIGTPHPRAPRGRPIDGVICLHPNGAVVGMGDDATTWLRSLANEWEAGAIPEDLMRCVHEVAAVARSAGRGPDAVVPVARTRLPDGRWLVASATRIGGSDVDVVVTLRSGDVDSVLPAFATWCGLSARETSVVSHLIGGLATKQMASRLGISPWTVDDHLRSVYRKAGVRGRDELVALLV